MSVVDVYKKSFDILKQNPKIVLPYIAYFIAIVVIEVIIFLSVGLLGAASGGAAALLGSGSFVGALALLGIIAALLSVLMSGTYLAIAGQGYDSGKVTLGAAFDVSKRRFVPLLGYTVIVIVIALVILVPFIAVGWSSLRDLGSGFGSVLSSGASGLTASSLTPLILLGFRVLSLFIIYILVAGIVSIFYYTGTAIIVLDNKGAVEALKQSIGIGRTRFVQIVGLYLLGLVIGICFAVVYVVLLIIPILGIILAYLLQFFFASWISMIPAVYYLNEIKKSAAPEPKKTIPKRTKS